MVMRKVVSARRLRRGSLVAYSYAARTRVGVLPLHLVEFIGPPASGKSTLARRLLAKGRRGSPLVDARLLGRPPRLGPETPAILSAASRFAPLARLLLGPASETAIATALDSSRRELGPLLSLAGTSTDAMDPVLRGLEVRWALQAIEVRALVEQARRANRPPLIAVSDEGLTHPYKIAAFGDPLVMPELIDLIPLPDIIVHVMLDEHVQVARIRERHAAHPNGPRERTWVGETEIRADIDRCNTVIFAVLDRARRDGMDVIEADGAGDPEVEAVRLLRQIEGATRTRTP